MVFAIYLRWATRKALVPSADCPNPSDQKFNDRLFDLYMLGDRLEDKAFKNAVADAILDGPESVPVKKPLPPHNSVCRVFEHTPTGFCLRKLMVTLWAWNAKPQDFKVDNVVALLDFYAEVLKLKARLRDRVPHISGTDSTDTLNYCNYHEHDDSAPVCE